MSARGDVLVHPASFVVEECCNCHMFFAMSRDFYDRRRFDGNSFFCPAGHSQHYTEGEKTALERKLAAEKKRADREAEWRHQAEERADDAWERVGHTERRLRATRGVLTRTKRRIAVGVCPCCKRHFVNLERHMKGQHPSFAPGEDRP